MEIIDSFLLGLIQGLTEFLPISSSGHLVLGKALLGRELGKSITFEVVVHFGTLCSILIYYRKKITSILSSLWELLINPSDFSNKLSTDSNIKLSGFILLSMIPALIVGLTLKDTIENVFLNPFMVSIMLLVTGGILFATKFRTRFPNNLGAGSAFGIGLAQAFAILPGISRSGSTISLGLYLGIKREEVANFSFLMVIPVIAGAMLLEVKTMIELGIPMAAFWDLAVGFITSFVSGYIALKYLIILLRTKGIHPFAWYCWIIGICGLIYFW
ncbi:undecaprenyl-diphosphate phosphatase [Fodinibius halophilus]|uniref:Undecaprenyl-diphosphatase n=1 Tax=Fodinibius halophilus TaxID=1736908 RepID=A0A6M1T1A9_9BACT|nr:undecaprenyl-diphosphate phosphatase [Fodinibius halophilus]NGP87767.1 undecaprenyl-diphosphate phosphatase [Fodinibius halophilus]